ncbi:MAG: outer membrane beta-barrel protein [Gammaproteobacteria bacterium]
MRKIITLFVGIFVSFIFVPLNCYAANTYIGVGIGQSKAKDAGNCSDLAGLFDPGYSCSIDDTDTSYNFFAGYKFTPNFAAELGYVNLGKYNIAASGTVSATPVSINGDWEPTGFTLSGVGILPIQPNFSVLGRIGFFNWNVDLNVNASIGGLPGSGSTSSSGTDLLYGVGVQWDANQQFSVRGEYTRYSNVGDENTTGQSDIDNLSISAIYNF